MFLPRENGDTARDRKRGAEEGSIEHIEREKQSDVCWEQLLLAYVRRSSQNSLDSEEQRAVVRNTEKEIQGAGQRATHKRERSDGERRAMASSRKREQDERRRGEGAAVVVVQGAEELRYTGCPERLKN